MLPVKHLQGSNPSLPIPKFPSAVEGIIAQADRNDESKARSHYEDQFITNVPKLLLLALATRLFARYAAATMKAAHISLPNFPTATRS